jgi:hypothetical protein
MFGSANLCLYIFTKKIVKNGAMAIHIVNTIVKTELNEFTTESNLMHYSPRIILTLKGR